MNNQCTGEWNMNFIATQFTKSFLDGPFRRHRKDVYFETERALLPATQPSVEAIMAVEERMPPTQPFPIESVQICIRMYLRVAKPYELLFVKFQGDNINNVRLLSTCWNNKMKAFRNMRKSIVKDKNMTNADLQEYNFNMDICESWKMNKDVIRNLQSQIIHIRNNAVYIPQDTVTAPALTEATKRRFIKPCPKDECRGFLSTQYQCGLCHCKVCSKCHVLKTSAVHTCNPDDLATAEFLMLDTKPCPKCATPIHKIDGCNQMWCTLCQTAFNWLSGKLVHGSVHNPHYFEFMQNRNRTQGQERNPNDILCGREVNAEFLVELLNFMTPSGNYIIVHRFVQNLIFLKEEVREFTVYDAMDNHKNRIAYLRKEIDEDTFKKQIFIRHKHNSMNREIRVWLLLLRDIWSELCFNLQDNLRNRNETTIEDIINMFLTEVEAAQELVNRNLKEFCQNFGIKTRFVNYNIHHDYWYIHPM